MLRATDVPGITKSGAYYPALELIFAEDVGLLGATTSVDDLQEMIMNVRMNREEIAHLVRAGTYYDAVGYNDSVLRIHQHYRSTPDDIPAYTQIVVDEYQDFSLLETELIDMLGDRSLLLVAGDDDQALYQFRHASPTYLRGLAEMLATRDLSFPSVRDAQPISSTPPMRSLSKPRRVDSFRTD